MHSSPIAEPSSSNITHINRTSGEGSIDNDPVMHNSSIESAALKTDCPACRIGNFPGGAHRCMICSRAVHIFDSCSLPLKNSEEGYGEQRICMDCAEKPNAPHLIESRAYENWGNQTKKFETRQNKSRKNQESRMKTTCHKQSRDQNENAVTKEACTEGIPEKKQQREQSETSRETTRCEGLKQTRPTGKYLQPTYAAHEFLLTQQLSAVPILKSGDETHLKPIRKGEQQIDLTHTCAFDSLFQLTLTAAFDSEIFLQNTIKRNIAADPFIKMIYDVYKNKVTSATYRTRSDILCNYFTKQGHSELNCLLVDCQTTVGGLCRKLLKNTPCFIETSTCEAECSPLIKKFPLLAITLKSLTAYEHNTCIEDEITVTKFRQCSSMDCSAELKTELEITGDSIFFEILSEDETIKLNEIPLQLKLSFMVEEFNLKGIIHFDEPSIPRKLRKTSIATMLDGPIGHYTAFCLRNGKWVQFDKKIKPRSPNWSVSPQIVLYSK